MDDVAYVDASPLIFLARTGLLEQLRLAAVRVVVPVAVAAEIRARGADDPTARAVGDARWLERTETIAVSPPLAALGLGAGESQVLSLAMATRGAVAILDDLAARRFARTHGIALRGTLGIVLLARMQGGIPAARPIIDALRRSGMHLSDVVVDDALREVGE